MMGRLCYIVDDKMLCGIIRDQLMARIGLDKYQVSFEKDGVRQMTFVGCSMEGNILINMNAIDDDHLGYWIKLCLDFNPLTKSNQNRK